MRALEVVLSPSDGPFVVRLSAGAVCGGYRMGNGINWKGQIFPKMRNYTPSHKMTGIGNALKTKYQQLLLEYEHVRILLSSGPTSFTETAIKQAVLLWFPPSRETPRGCQCRRLWKLVKNVPNLGRLCHPVAGVSP